MFYIFFVVILPIACILLRLRSVTLLVVLDLFQPIKFFSVHFVKLGIYVAYGILCAWNNDVFDGVDPPVDNLNNLV